MTENDPDTIIQSVDGYVLWLHLAEKIHSLLKTLFSYLNVTGSASLMYRKTPSLKMTNGEIPIEHAPSLIVTFWRNFLFSTILPLPFPSERLGAHTIVL